MASLTTNNRANFDFTNKKIAFVTGSAATKLVTKQEYFLTYVKPLTDRGAIPQISFVPFTNEEKLQSNGYDGIVLSFVKIFTNKTRKKIIDQLRRNK